MTPYYSDESVTLYHGDCLDVMPQLDPVDHCITDPPYARDVYLRAGRVAADRQGGALRKMAAGEIGWIDDLIIPMATRIWNVADRWVVIFSDVETCHRWRLALEDTGFRYVRTGAWVKPDPMPQMTGDRPCVGFEPCTIAHGHGRMRWNGGGSAAVWTHGTAKGDGRPEGHPCPKPVPLMAELIKDFTDEGETIIDPFGGSGTTGVAAKLNGRKAILIEREEKYCEIAAKRLAQTQPGRLFDAIKAKPQSLPMVDEGIA